jgi:hypothetical protein
MIDPSLFFAFFAATTVLMLIPGPNVALIVANSVAYGSRYGLVTGQQSLGSSLSPVPAGLCANPPEKNSGILLESPRQSWPGQLT